MGLVYLELQIVQAAESLNFDAVGREGRDGFCAGELSTKIDKKERKENWNTWNK